MPDKNRIPSSGVWARLKRQPRSAFNILQLWKLSFHYGSRQEASQVERMRKRDKKPTTNLDNDCFENVTRLAAFLKAVRYICCSKNFLETEADFI